MDAEMLEKHREFIRQTVEEVAWVVEFRGRGDAHEYHCRYCRNRLESGRDRDILFRKPKIEWPHRDDCPLLAEMRVAGMVKEPV